MPTQADSFRAERARELQELAELLNIAELGIDTGPLYAAATQCQYEHEGNAWGYRVENLIFRLEVRGRAIPQQIIDPSLILNLTVQGACEAGGEFCDPFHAYQMEIVIQAQGRVGGQPVELRAAWHLDRDEPDVNDGLQRFVHPVYHMQYGGRTMRDSGLAFGSALILESPRIAHPPLDAILAVDFVLTNYFESNRLQFRQELRYASLLTSATHRIWRPYAHALAAAWPDRMRGSWPAIRLWPQLPNLTGMP